MSPEAKKIIRMSNFLESGFTINLDDVDAEVAYYVQYYQMTRKSMEEGAKFETLFKGLTQLAKGLLGK